MDGVGREGSMFCWAGLILNIVAVVLLLVSGGPVWLPVVNAVVGLWAYGVLAEADRNQNMPLNRVAAVSFVSTLTAGVLVCWAVFM